jgi:vacuolar-type H+-ATPase subunit H
MMASTREGDPMEEQLAATAADEAAEPVVATVSPLVRIREKEVEISGRILAARSEAEQIMGDARRAAADIIHQAETEAEELSKGVVQDSLARGDVEANRIREEAEAKVASLETRLAERRDAAVDLIVSTVTSAQS